MAAALEAARAGADLVACAVYPVALAVHRVSGESLAQALAGLGLDTGVDVAALWEASELVDEHIGDEPVTPLAPRIAVRAAEHGLPAGLVAGIDASLRAAERGDRLDEVLDELVANPGGGRLAAARRADRPDPRLAGAASTCSRRSATGRSSTSCASSSWAATARRPAPIDPAVERAVELVTRRRLRTRSRSRSRTLREQTEGLASSEEELLLLALFGDEAEPLLRSIRGRAGGDETLAARGRRPGPRGADPRDRARSSRSRASAR